MHSRACHDQCKTVTPLKGERGPLTFHKNSKTVNSSFSVINMDRLHVDARERVAHAAARWIMLVGVQTLSNSWMRAFLLSLAILTPAVPTLQDPHDEERKQAEMVRERREEGRGE